jgi:hypothetical protein
LFPPAILAVIGRSDPIALADCLEEHDSSGIADFATLAAPTLLISGELEDPDDEAADVAARLQHGEHLWLPQLGHAGAGAASDLAVPAVRSFLDRWTAPNTSG